MRSGKTKEITADCRVGGFIKLVPSSNKREEPGNEVVVLYVILEKNHVHLNRL